MTARKGVFYALHPVVISWGPTDKQTSLEMVELVEFGCIVQDNRGLSQTVVPWWRCGSHHYCKLLHWNTKLSCEIHRRWKLRNLQCWEPLPSYNWRRHSTMRRLSACHSDLLSMQNHKTVMVNCSYEFPDTSSAWSLDSISKLIGDISITKQMIRLSFLCHSRTYHLSKLTPCCMLSYTVLPGQGTHQ